MACSTCHACTASQPGHHGSRIHTLHGGGAAVCASQQPVAYDVEERGMLRVRDEPRVEIVTSLQQQVLPKTDRHIPLLLAQQMEQQGTPELLAAPGGLEDLEALVSAAEVDVLREFAIITEAIMMTTTRRMQSPVKKKGIQVI